jgi:hypothetical protein
MAETYKEVQRTTTVREGDADEPVQTQAVVTDGTTLAARIVSLIGGIIMAILAMRFVLSLLGANRGNVFADFIYTFSQPFAAPFFGLFNYQPQFGVVRFEFETLIAIGFWGFITWVIIQVITIGTRD